MTIKEIAQQAGVSIGTVDRVIHNRGRVAKATRDKVQQIARDGNFEPNPVARGLALSRQFTIAILLPNDNEYWAAMNKGIREQAGELAGIGIITRAYNFNRQEEGSFSTQAAEMLATTPDGVIMAPLEESKAAEICRALEEKKVPYSFVDSDMPSTNPLTFIGQDSRQSGYLAAKLLTLGYPAGTDIYAIRIQDFDSLNKTIDERLDGLQAYFEEQGFDDCQIHEIGLNDNWDEVVREAQRHCDESRPMHIFIPNSRAHEVGKALKPVGGQYRIVGYDLIKENEQCLREGIIDFVIDQNPKEQGKLALETFNQRLVMNEGVDKQHFMPIEIIIKENLDFR